MAYIKQNMANWKQVPYPFATIKYALVLGKEGETAELVPEWGTKLVYL